VKQGIAYLVLGATALPAAAGVDVNINLPFFGRGAYAPPVVYRPDPYYAMPPAVVYRGGGHWGDDGRGHSRGRRSGGEKHHK
jgi:hypothetical protein